jgi:hypothetical protein
MRGILQPDRKEFLMKKIAFLVVACAIGGAFFPEESHAQVRAQFSYDAVANCERPRVSNFPIHYEGTGKLSTDRSASLDLESNVNGHESYDVRLGAKATAAQDGSASLHVSGRHSLRAVRDYPNNILVVDLRVVGTTCTITIDNRLKPGKRQYTFPTVVGLAYCDKPQLTRTSCRGI